jgi:hypothetical protein
MLGSCRVDPLGCTIGDVHAHGGEAGAQPPHRYPPPTDLSPFRILEYGMSRPGFDIRHVPNTGSATRRYREDQLYIGRITLLVPGNANGPAQVAR